MRMLLPSLLPSLALVSVAASSGCIIDNRYDDDDEVIVTDPYGDLAFDWSFDGIASCDEAGVDEVDVAIFHGGELVQDLQREPCEGGGLLFPDVYEGLYEVFLDAYDRNGQVLYSGSFDIVVRGGQTNDAGLVVFERVGDAPPPTATGELALFWLFPYPTDNTITFDCALAGVDEIDIHLEPQGTGGAAYDDTFGCDDEGVSVANLPEGRYDLQLQAFGSYHGDALLLYDTGVITVDVFADELEDLGDVTVPRVDESFADFDIAWTFVDDTCAGAGVETVTLAFQRSGFAEPEDSFDIDCGASSVLRATFVPGSYAVNAFAAGDDTDYLGSTTVDLPPDSVAQIDLVLAPIAD